MSRINPYTGLLEPTPEDVDYGPQYPAPLAPDSEPDSEPNYGLPAWDDEPYDFGGPSSLALTQGYGPEYQEPVAAAPELPPEPDYEAPYLDRLQQRRAEEYADPWSRAGAGLTGVLGIADFGSDVLRGGSRALGVNPTESLLSPWPALAGMARWASPADLRERTQAEVARQQEGGRNLVQALAATESERPEDFPGQKSIESSVLDPFNALPGIGVVGDVRKVLRPTAQVAGEALEAAGRAAKGVIADESGMARIGWPLNPGEGGDDIIARLQAQIDDVAERAGAADSMESGALFDELDRLEALKQQAESADDLGRWVEGARTEYDAKAMDLDFTEEQVKNHPLKQWDMLIPRTGEWKDTIPETLPVGWYRRYIDPTSDYVPGLKDAQRWDSDPLTKNWRTWKKATQDARLRVPYWQMVDELATNATQGAMDGQQFMQELLNLRNLENKIPGLRYEVNKAALIVGPSPQVRATAPGTQERGFAERIRQLPETPEPLRLDLEARPETYNPLSNVETAARAAQALDADPSGARAALFGSSESFESADSAAVGELMLRRAEEAGDWDEAQVIARHVSERYTVAGQVVQAASMYARMAPDGILRTVVRTVEDAVKKAPAVRQKGKRERLQRHVQQQSIGLERKAVEAETAATRSVLGEIDEAANEAWRGFNAEVTAAPEGDPFKKLLEMLEKAASRGLDDDAAMQTARARSQNKSVHREIRTSLERGRPVRAGSLMDVVRSLLEAEEGAMRIRRPKEPMLSPEVAQRYMDEVERILAMPRGPEKTTAKLDLMQRLSDDTSAADAAMQAGSGAKVAEREAARSAKEAERVQAAGNKPYFTRFDDLAEQARLLQQEWEQLKRVPAGSPESIRAAQAALRKQGKDLTALTQRTVKATREAVKDVERETISGLKRTAGNNDLILSPEVAQSFVRRATALKQVSSERDRTLLAAEMMTDMYRLIPADFGTKASTGQILAQLFFPKTIVRNIGGNTLLGALENLTQMLSLALDVPLSKVTGIRSETGPEFLAGARGAVKGARESAQEVHRGVNLGPETQYDLGRQRTFDKDTPLFGGWETGLNYVLRVPDRIASQAAYESTLMSMAKVTAMNEGIKDPVRRGVRELELLNQPTQDMKDIAQAEALYRTLQDNSIAAKVLTGIQKTFNLVGFGGRVRDFGPISMREGGFGVGHMVLRYPKTPGNILMRAVDYSPTGFINTVFPLWKMLRGENSVQNQRALVQSISRSLIGSAGLTYTGYILASAGLMTGRGTKDRDLSALERQEGLRDYSLNTSGLARWVLSGFSPEAAKWQRGDNQVTWDWAQPLAISAAMGVGTSEDEKLQSLKESKRRDQVNESVDFIGGLATVFGAGADYFNVGADTLAQQGMLSGLKKLFGYNDIVGGLAEIMKSVPASFVPAMLRGLRDVTDNTMRETHDENAYKVALNQVVANIPIWSATLPERYTTLGDPMDRYQSDSNNIFNVFLNPAFSGKYLPTPEAEMVLELYKATGEVSQAPRRVQERISIAGQWYTLTGEEMGEYQALLGAKTREAFGNLAASDKFQAASDTEKIKFMGSIITGLDAFAKDELRKRAVASDGSVAHFGMMDPLKLKKQGETANEKTALEFFEAKQRMDAYDAIDEIMRERTPRLKALYERYEALGQDKSPAGMRAYQVFLQSEPWEEYNKAVSDAKKRERERNKQLLKDLQRWKGDFLQPTGTSGTGGSSGTGGLGGGGGFFGGFIR